MMAIPSARLADRSEFVQDVQVLGADDTLLVYAGKRHIGLKPSDLEHYYGERGRRGAKLPRGFQNVDRMEVERKG
jgi:topoisomerase-4 subunit A